MPKKKKLIAVKSSGAKMFATGKNVNGHQLVTIERNNKMAKAIKPMSVRAHS